MTKEEKKQVAKSYGIGTGEFVALKRIYKNQNKNSDISEDDFLDAVIDLLGIRQNGEA